jgi:hypothetical protein
MKPIETKLPLSKTGINLILSAILSLLALSSVIAADLSLDIQQERRASSPIDGDWELFLTEDGKDPKGSVFEFPLGMSLKHEGNNPIGIIRFPIMVATNNGPKPEGVSEKALLDPKFDGKKFTFRVEGDEKGEFLEMTLGLSGENFVGRWKILNSNDGGSVRMLRKQSITSRNEQIKGEWVVILYSEDGIEGDRGVLIVKADGDRLTAKTTFKVDGVKREWALINPKFDGEAFLFKVDNGEEVLTGNLLPKNDQFEGPWKASRSGVSGKMKLIRKK